MRAYVSLPMRIFCYFISGGSVLLIFLPVYLIYVEGFSLGLFLLFVFFMLLPFFGINIFKQTFITITITESGVVAYNRIGIEKKIQYDEILEIRKPWFGRWGDFFFIVSKSGKKIPISKLMRNSNKVISIIHDKTGCNLVNFPSGDK